MVYIVVILAYIFVDSSIRLLMSCFQKNLSWIEILYLAADSSIFYEIIIKMAFVVICVLLIGCYMMGYVTIKYILNRKKYKNT
jgi:hypothetical protein